MFPQTVQKVLPVRHTVRLDILDKRGYREQLRRCPVQRPGPGQASTIFFKS